MFRNLILFIGGTRPDQRHLLMVHCSHCFPTNIKRVVAIINLVQDEEPPFALKDVYHMTGDVVFGVFIPDHRCCFLIRQEPSAK